MIVIYGDGVFMTEESLNLFLIVNVPDAEHAIFATTDEVLAVWWDSAAQNLVEVTFMLLVELFSSEEKLFLRFQIPYFQKWSNFLLNLH